MILVILNPKNMLHTFFFGYLPFKWKRLARVLSIVFSIAVPVIVAASGKSWDVGGNLIVTFIIIIIIVPIISYTLKPFVVKE
tara:strand:+ start:261 stop:506 length:246 start_codon:yes stop_codon:yes gene_type:complete